ncbi:GNAT family N-acetyltransferase [Oscillatoriales cyanobacterium LEGE 11467]|uniref:GNAT family N-acetyltransferase n=1 Tax=Zarconia navalis LEGE 11467 TaxID=1828826 RepID=A0A928Z914_9CYAN|nr:GNAT family N-acetyltransferase [Zarconia navalis]MBE9040361.1 GNAT family N-acetyltransferase [Zarconia navalis LEGE 11467]
MMLIFRSIDRVQAHSILNWQYPYPYERYNFNPQNTQQDLLYLLDRKNAFFAILNPQNELEAYCSFGADARVPGGGYSADALDIGMGIRPDLVGRRLGKHYARAVVRYSANRYCAKYLRVTIAQFNQRACKVWQKLGFEIVETFKKMGTQENFIVMTLTVVALKNIVE